LLLYLQLKPNSTRVSVGLYNDVVFIVFPFIIWFYGSAIVIIRGWGCGFGDSEDIVTWSDNRPSFTVLGFMAVVAYCRGI
jgi:hypothetical protein